MNFRTKKDAIGLLQAKAILLHCIERHPPRPNLKTERGETKLLLVVRFINVVDPRRGYSVAHSRGLK